MRDSFGLIPPYFFGQSHTKENAHQLFAMVIDIDYVGLQQLKNMLKQPVLIDLLQSFKDTLKAL